MYVCVCVDACVGACVSACLCGCVCVSRPDLGMTHPGVSRGHVVTGRGRQEEKQLDG